MGWWIWNLGCLVTVVVGLAGASDAGEVSQQTARGWSVLATPFLLLGLIVIALVGWWMFVARPRIAVWRDSQEQAEKEFEAGMKAFLKQHQRQSQSSSAPDISASQANLIGQPPLAMGVKETTAGRSTGAQPSGPVEDILARLRAGGIFGGEEGTLFLSDGQTQGRIIRLSDGKTAFVMPRPESAEFMARQLKRFDMCLVPLPEGEICAVSRFADFIASRIVF